MAEADDEQLLRDEHTILNLFMCAPPQARTLSPPSHTYVCLLVRLYELVRPLYDLCTTSLSLTSSFSTIAAFDSAAYVAFVQQRQRQQRQQQRQRQQHQWRRASQPSPQPPSPPPASPPPPPSPPCRHPHRHRCHHQRRRPRRCHPTVRLAATLVATAFVTAIATTLAIAALAARPPSPRHRHHNHRQSYERATQPIADGAWRLLWARQGSNSGCGYRSACT